MGELARNIRQESLMGGRAIRLSPEGAIRALGGRPKVVAGYVRGRPREYDPEKLRGPLKAIWLGPCNPAG
jgi:hypothetical protein